MERDNIAQMLQNDMRTQNNLTVQIVKSGEPGATSKKIYQNLFLPESADFSSRKILVARPNYCVVFAGVNDAARHMGKKYYAYHLRLIAETLLHYDIRPVVVLLPRFGVKENYQSKNLPVRVENRIYEFWDGGDIENVDAYRQELLSVLKQNKKVVIFNPDNYDLVYQKRPDLFLDPLHLNHAGYTRLAEGLAKTIADIDGKK